MGDISAVCLGAPHRDKSSSISVPVRVLNVGDLGPDGAHMSNQETLQLLPARVKKYSLLTNDVIVAVRGTVFKSAVFKERTDTVTVLGSNLARVRMADPNLALVVAAAITCQQSTLSAKFYARRRVRAGGFIGKDDIEDFLFRIPSDKALAELITMLEGAQEEVKLLSTLISNRRKLVDDLVYQLMLKQVSS